MALFSMTPHPRVAHAHAPRAHACGRAYACGGFASSRVALSFGRFAIFIYYCSDNACSALETGRPVTSGNRFGGHGVYGILKCDVVPFCRGKYTDKAPVLHRWQGHKRGPRAHQWVRQVRPLDGRGATSPATATPSAPEAREVCGCGAAGAPSN
jgi:hypothetical protein